MRHNKLLKFGLLVGLVFGLSACGDDSSKSPQSAAPSDSKASQSQSSQPAAKKPSASPKPDMKKAMENVEKDVEAAKTSVVEKVEREAKSFSPDTDLVEAYREILESQDLATFKKSSKLDGKVTLHIDASEAVIDELNALSDKSARNARAVELFCEKDILGLAKAQQLEMRVKVWKPDGGFSPLAKADCSDPS